eukprot:COSAG05_NODE_2728_length_2712_cov_2.977507_4_plen_45_part_01
MTVEPNIPYLRTALTLVCVCLSLFRSVSYFFSLCGWVCLALYPCT